MKFNDLLKNKVRAIPGTWSVLEWSDEYAYMHMPVITVAGLPTEQDGRRYAIEADLDPLRYEIRYCVTDEEIVEQKRAEAHHDWMISNQEKLIQLMQVCKFGGVVTAVKMGTDLLADMRKAGEDRAQYWRKKLADGDRPEHYDL